MRNKTAKGFSPLVAAILLIAFTIAIAGILATWATIIVDNRLIPLKEEIQKNNQTGDSQMVDCLVGCVAGMNYNGTNFEKVGEPDQKALKEVAACEMFCKVYIENKGKKNSYYS